ncbi:MAG: invasin domain 3-containing protein [Pseudomonadota bacterium]
MPNSLRPLSTIYPILFSLAALTPGARAQSGVDSHLESGAASFTSTVSGTDVLDSTGWVAVSFASAYGNLPVVIPGPVSHGSFASQAGEFSVSVRLRNITTTGFEIGVLRPEGLVSALTPALTATWLAIEPGRYILGGLAAEVGRHSTTTVRSNVAGGSGSAGDFIFFSQAFAAEPALLHGLQTQNHPQWIATTAYGSTTAQPPTTTSFRLALEGAEVVAQHPSPGASVAETIGWIAIDRGTAVLVDSLGNNRALDAGRSANFYVDRHQDGCFALPVAPVVFGFGGTPHAAVSHNSMQGTNGAWIRRCFPNATAGSDLTQDQVWVHLDEDQVGDAERTGLQEFASWFAIEPGAEITIPRDIALPEVTKTAQDQSPGLLEPGDTLQYELILSNGGTRDILDRAGFPELVDAIPTYTSYVAGSASASAGAIGFNSSLHRIEWNGDLTTSTGVTLRFRVQLATAIPNASLVGNQATLQYDSDGDGSLDGIELSDDPATLADDDPTVLRVTSVSPAASQISAVPSSVVANGSTTSTLTVILEDGFGNRVAGQSVVLQTTAGTLLGSVVEQGNGVYTQDLQSTTTTGNALVTTVVNGHALAGPSASVDFVAGPADDAASSLTASPTTIVVGTGQSLLRVRLVDGLGNPVPGQAVEILSSLGVLIGSVQDLGTGDYTQILVASQSAGTASLSFRVNGVDFSDLASVVFAPAAPDSSRSSIAALPSTITADGASTSVLTATVRDSYDNGVPGRTVVFSTSAGNLGTVSDLGDGRYQVVLSSVILSQDATVSFTVDGGTGYPTTVVRFVPGTVDLARSTIAAAPSVIFIGTGSALITVRVVDAHDNPIPGQTVAMTLLAGSCAFAASGVQDLGDGRYTRALNAGNTVESCRVGFSINGPAAADSVDVQVVSSGPLDAYSTIAASPVILVADGASTSMVTVILEDQYGTRQPGHAVVVSTNAGTLVPANGAASDLGNGVYTLLLQSSTSVALAQLSFTVDGAAYSDQAAVSFVAGAPVDAGSTISAAPATLIASGSEVSAVTVFLVDTQGNPAPGHTVVVTSSQGTLGNPGGVATDNSDGSYSITLTSSTSLVSAVLGFSVVSSSVTFTSTATVAFVAGPVADAASLVEASPASLVADGASLTTIAVTLGDGYGHPVTSASVSCSSAGRGTWQATMVEVTPGHYEQDLQVDTLATPIVVQCVADGTALSDGASIVLLAGPPDSGHSVATVLPATLTADGSSTSTVTVTLRDANDNPVAGATAVVTTSEGSVAAVADLGNGTYTATYTAGIVLGGATLDVSVNGLSSFVQTTIVLLPGPSSAAASTIAVADPSLVADSGQSTLVTVVVRDDFNHALAGHAVVIATTTGSLEGAVVDVGNGSYTQTLRAPDTVSTALLSFTIDGLTADATATVAFVAGAVDPSTTTIAATPSVLVADGLEESTVTVRTQDANGNPVPGRAVRIATSLGSASSTVETSPGVYEATLTAGTTPGTATLSFSVDAQPFPATAEVTLVSGEALDDNSDIVVADSRLLADGISQTTVTVTLRDASGNGVAGATVTLHSTAGALGSVLDLGDGRYTASLTSGSAPGTATLSYDVDGVPFADVSTVIFVADEGDLDEDADGIVNRLDNCWLIPNPGQENGDADRAGDVCDLDDDNDGVVDLDDNCPGSPNAEQGDQDGNGVGDVCDPDRDGDGVNDLLDLCPRVADPLQADGDNDGVGDACDLDVDSDGDGFDDGADLCPGIADPAQGDLDGDGIGDACDADADGDGVADERDNCPGVANHGQANHDSDAEGDACDDDDDEDGVVDSADNCPPLGNPGQQLVCRPDRDGDTVPDSIDNCPDDLNIDQRDGDADGLGDPCDPMFDDAGVANDATATDTGGSSDAASGADIGSSMDATTSDVPPGDSAVADGALPVDAATGDTGALQDGGGLADASAQDALTGDTTAADALPLQDAAAGDTLTASDANPQDSAGLDAGFLDVVGTDVELSDLAGLDSTGTDTTAIDAATLPDGSVDSGIDSGVVQADAGRNDAVTRADNGRDDLVVGGGGCVCRGGTPSTAWMGVLLLVAWRRRRAI